MHKYKNMDTQTKITKLAALVGLELTDVTEYLAGDLTWEQGGLAHTFCLAWGLIAPVSRKFVVTRTGRELGA